MHLSCPFQCCKGRSMDTWMKTNYARWESVIKQYLAPPWVSSETRLWMFNIWYTSVIDLRREFYSNFSIDFLLPKNIDIFKLCLEGKKGVKRPLLCAKDIPKNCCEILKLANHNRAVEILHHLLFFCFWAPIMLKHLKSYQPFLIPDVRHTLKSGSPTEYRNWDS